MEKHRLHEIYMAISADRHVQRQGLPLQRHDQLADYAAEFGGKGTYRKARPGAWGERVFITLSSFMAGMGGSMHWSMRGGYMHRKHMQRERR